ncbi:MAG: DUF1552 domain-containing protein [Myxococcota bacterium]
MTVRKFGRRWMLLGGGASLLIPALPSLIRGNRTQAQGPAIPKRMVMFMTEHGGVWQQDMYPDESAASTSFSHPLHTCHRGPLTPRMEDGDRLVSEALRAPAGVLTESIASKMNLFRGLDVPFYYGHARHLLGNYGDMSNNHDEFPPDQETADQVMAHSTAVYATPPRRRLIHFGNQALSVELVDRSRGPAGGVQPTEEVSAATVFDSVYVPTPDEGMPMREPPINAIYESYARLQSGAFGAGARLGSEDRRRLTQYMDRLSDIRAALITPPIASCDDVDPIDDLPGRWDRYGSDNYQLYNDVIMAGFMCDSSRVAVIRVNDPFTEEVRAYPGGYHEVAHQAPTREDAALAERLRGMLLRSSQAFFRGAFLDLVGKLDAVLEGEGTMLDNSLVWWSPEAGCVTHNGDSIPVVAAGSAGGAITTGNYLDLRNRENNPADDGRRAEVLAHVGRRPGVCYFQWTTTYLDAFGIPRSEWQVPGRSAFSGMGPNHSWMMMQYDQAAMDASCADPLPIMT